MNKISLMLLFALVGFIPAKAQDGLNIAQFFRDAYKGVENVTFVEISGDKLSDSGLTKYKSISVSGNADLAEKIERAVRKDGAHAKSKEVIFKKGMLHFGMYSMGGSGRNKRYVYYLNSKPTGKNKATLIYVEGNLSDEEAKALITK